MRFCSIASSSSGNCTYVGTESTHVLVDAGLSGKRIEQGLASLELSARDLSGILLTHEHADHIKGLGVLSRKYGIPIFTTGGTADALLRSRSAGAIPPDLIREIAEDVPFTIGDMVIHAFGIPHDAAQPVGFRLSDGQKSFGIATDLGRYSDYIIDNLSGLNGLLLEANHDVRMLETGRYPYPLKMRILGNRGHLSNDDAGDLLGKLLWDGMQTVLLGHLSKENNYEALAYETVRQAVALGDNSYKADDFSIQVASQEAMSEVVNL